MVELRLLGPLEVWVDGRPLSFRGRRPRALLAALALRGEPVSAERLIDDLWGERPPATAKNSLHNAVSALRKALGPDVLVSRPPGYTLAIDPERIDAVRFQRLAELARAASSPDERAATLREALQLWRGPALADLAFEPFALLEVPRLEELRLGAEQDLIEAELELGRHADVLPRLEALVSEHPYDERLRGQLMLALYRSGRQADALEAYRQTREFLLEELGLDPSLELRELQQAILGQDEALAAPAPARAPLLPVRKTVTILFADLVDSTALAQQLDPEALRRLLERTFATARAIVELHGGTVEHFLGDAVLAVFGLPVAHEDDALRALRAAVDLREAVSASGEGLELRIGVNTGEVYAGGSETSRALVTGAAVNLTKRLEEDAAPGEILLGPATFRLVREAAEVEEREPLRLSDGSAVGVWSLLSLVEGAPAIPRRFQAPLVGREHELARLRTAFEEAREEERCRLVVLAGEPGIGKTRLANELCSQLADAATVLTGRCVPYGAGATWLPLVDALRAVVGDDPAAGSVSLLGDERDASRVSRVLRALFGASEAGAPGSTGELFWAVRRILVALARGRPVLLVLEDAHWAEPTLLDLVEYLEGFTEGPLLVVPVTRPELLEERAGWAQRALVLEPLAADELRALAEELAPAQTNASERGRVAEVAEGNPLFAEQLLAWAGEGGGLDQVPPSIEALLQSRIDALPEDRRGALERAAVLGREFTSSAVRALSPPDAAPALASTLVTLTRSGFLAPAPAAALREDAFRFHHALVRDVAYAGIPKTARAELHEAAAEWLDGEGDAPDEIVGYHLEQAYRYREQVAPVDRHARALAADAGRRLGDAGIRAWKRADVPATVNLLTRATTLLPPEDEFRRELMCELGIALRTGGEGERAKQVLSDVVGASAALRDRRLELRGLIELASVRLSTEPAARPDDFLAVVGDAISAFEAVGDDRSLARGWLLRGYLEGTLRCQNEVWKEAAERAMSHYKRSGWPPLTPANNLAAALYHGPTCVDDGIHRCEALLEELADRGGKANVVVILAVLKALAGGFKQARELAAQAGRTYRELGQSHLAATNAGWAHGEIELLAGNPRAAELALRRVCESLRATGESMHLSSRAAELAEALYAQGRDAGASRWARISERNTSGFDITAQVQWREIRAKLLARRGEADKGENLAREAVALIEETDALNQRGKALLDLAEVLQLAGRFDEAVPFVDRAGSLYQQKGNRVGVKRTQALLAELAPV